MNKTLLAVAAVAVAALAPTMASAATEEFQFNSADITATFSIDVVGGQAVNGGGELWSPYWTGPDPMTLVTLSTTDVHDLGGGSLSYRFGGGTDLIGDTATPIDDWGLVFTVNTNPNLDVGFNLWSNNNGSYTGFIAGNSPATGRPIIYLGETGAAALTGASPVPEASTWAMMLAGFGGLGFAGFYHSRRGRVSAIA
jgi:opacity protein-like surface antigen